MSYDKPIALWSVPHSISTAFERIFVERDELGVKSCIDADIEYFVFDQHDAALDGSAPLRGYLCGCTAYDPQFGP